MEKESLEKKLRPDWKQWIPIFGLIQMARDAERGKPFLASKKINPLLNRTGKYYHLTTCSIVAFTITYRIELIINKYIAPYLAKVIR